jgi:hypothetical protein
MHALSDWMQCLAACSDGAAAAFVQWQIVWYGVSAAAPHILCYAQLRCVMCCMCACMYGAGGSTWPSASAALRLLLSQDTPAHISLLSQSGVHSTCVVDSGAALLALVLLFQVCACWAQLAFSQCWLPACCSCASSIHQMYCFLSFVICIRTDSGGSCCEQSASCALPTFFCPFG